MIRQGGNAPITIYLMSPLVENYEIEFLDGVATLSYRDEIVKEWSLQDMEFYPNRIELPLTQEETMALEPRTHAFEAKFSKDGAVLFTVKRPCPVEKRVSQKILQVSAENVNENGTEMYMDIITEVHYLNKGTGTSDHSKLSNLGFDESGHTGYARDIQGKLAETALQRSEIYDWALSPVKPVYNAEEVGAITLSDIPHWALADEKPTYTAEEVGALPENTPYITIDTEELRNYYTKLDTFTKSETLTEIAKVKSFGKKYVDELPAVGEEDVIYFVPKPGGSEYDYKIEYVWDSINRRYEIFGSTQINVEGLVEQSYLEDNYYTQTQSDSRYESKFVKNSAFNKNYGTTADTVVSGDRVLTPVPAGAIFTDHVFDDSDVVEQISLAGTMMPKSDKVVAAPFVRLSLTMEDGQVRNLLFVGVEE